jgi:hypothetical protein
MNIITKEQESKKKKKSQCDSPAANLPARTAQEKKIRGTKQKKKVSEQIEVELP